MTMDCEDEVSTRVLQRSRERQQPDGVVVSLCAHRRWRSARHHLCSHDAVVEDERVVDEEKIPAPTQHVPFNEPEFWLPALIALLSYASIIGIYWGLLSMLRPVVWFPT